MNRIYFSVILFISWGSASFAQQRPFINSFDPVKANVNETVTINGSGFPTSINNLQVYFGSGKATVISTSSNQIFVSVPASATLAPITVINTSTGFSATSSGLFTLSFGGNFNASNFGSIVDRLTGQRLAYDVCLCDFDGDGKNDIVTTARNQAETGNTSRVIYRNTSTTAGTLQLSAPINLGTAIPSTNVNCADLDGDGKPDLVVTQINNTTGTQNVEYYRNTTTGTNITFATVQTFVPKRDANNNFRPAIRIELEDLDGDGKKDLIISNETDRFFDIHLNTSSVGAISFNTADPFQLALPAGDLVARGIKIADLNNDLRPDIIVAPFNDRPLYVFQNNSSAGNLQFSSATALPGTTQFNYRNIAVADFNSDGKIDIVATDGNSSSTVGRVVLYINTTTQNGGTSTFSNPLTFNTSGNEPWGIDVGDVDGDGKPDFVIGIAEPGFNRIELFRNTFSGTGNVTFSQHLLVTNFNSRNIKIGDINGDAKPDFIFASRSQNLQPAILSIIENRICQTPVISPSSGVFCPSNVGGGTFNITATPGEGTTYTWQVNQDNAGFVDVAGNNTNTLDISAFDANLQIRVVATSGACSEVSTVATFTKNNQTPANPAITGDLSYCQGETIQLTSSVTADIYTWTGPNNFSQSGNSNTINIPNAGSINAGQYTLRVQATGGCLSQIATANVVINSTPTPNISNSGPDAFCEGGQTTLSMTNYPGFNYQWTRNGTNLGTNASQVANQSGNYTVTIIDPVNNCQEQSTNYSITEVNPPVSTVSGATEICEEVAFTLTAATNNILDPFTVAYNWTFLNTAGATDGTATGAETTYTFNTPGEYTARLITRYNEIDNCESTNNTTITVSATPTDIQIEATSLDKCPADSVLLTLPQDFTSYNWSTGDTQFSTYAKTPVNQDEVTVSVTGVTAVGCTITDEITISNFPNSGLIITSTVAEVVDNELNIPAGTISIQLSANNGSNYSWEPADIFDDARAANVTVFPRNVQTLITLSGDDINNCETSTDLLLINDNVIGRKSFSPNGDGLGFDCWEILNATTLTGCEVMIFDKRGRNLLKANSPFDSDCIWDGNSNGTPAPPGVYYYVLKCSDSDLNRSGPILLAR